MYFWLVVLALVLAWVIRLGLAKRAVARFCGTDCLTLAVKVPGPSRSDKNWKHGYARLSGDVLQWRREYKLSDGFDYEIRRVNLVVRDHRPVVKGEAMLSDRCELVNARHMDEDIQLAVLKDDLDRLLEWAGR
ncbi:MAG TPA: DUF2550 family protein [Frankiaceae bacterium]|nr:DUF2550 family protein [Frankiaceae bacterium]